MSEPDDDPWDPAFRPEHCGTLMRGILVDDLPKGLRRWVCDRCGFRQWFLYGEVISDVNAVAYSLEANQRRAPCPDGGRPSS